MSEEKTAKAAHPLDLPAMAAFAANYGLSGDHAARTWGTAAKSTQEHFRMVADAAITASRLGDALAELVAEPQPAPEAAAAMAEIMRLRAALESLASPEPLTVTYASYGSQAAEDELAARRKLAQGNLDRQAAGPKPAPELAERKLSITLNALQRIDRTRRTVVDQAALWDIAQRAIDEVTDVDGQLPQPAPELAAAMAETRELRERVARTAAKLDADALATAPSKKSEIQREVAARLRETLGDQA